MFKITIKGVKSKKIGKFFRISVAQYKKDTAFIYVYDYKTNKKYRVGEFKETEKNHHALSIYNSANTVKFIEKLIQDKSYSKI